MSSDVTVTTTPDRRRYEAVGDTMTVAAYVECQETSKLVVLTDGRSTTRPRTRCGRIGWRTAGGTPVHGGRSWLEFMTATRGCRHDARVAKEDDDDA